MTAARKTGLYVHVPFCRQRCHFCAFYLEIGRSERMEAFRIAVAREIDLCRKENLLGDRALQTVYFGGGTPTALPAGHLVEILRVIRRTWPVSPQAEITVEAHPSTVTAEDLSMLAAAGFNRISFGAESMDERNFALIGRPGTVRDTHQAVAAARGAGFTNINLDLMYGLPGQGLADWTNTLEQLLALDPSHVSCYALTVEEGTRLAQEIERGLLARPDDSQQIDMESEAEAILTRAGFTRYELSNYAKPESACRHNLLYWTDHDYLGLGPSAQSYVDGVRFGNIADLTAYLDALDRDRLPLGERMVLSTAEQRRDALVFGLRLLRGIPTQAVADPDHHRIVRDLEAKGLLVTEADRIRLTPLGRRFADTVAADLF